jgi:glycosyltransferase involved in cell wall biosynthesis
MARASAAVAGGARAADLPAFRLTADARARVAGLLPLMEHFDWRDPPPDEAARHARGRLRALIPEEARPMPRTDELVVFSHLPWTFVWQRPQHLVSRLGRGRTVWFVEEPQVADVTEPRLRTEERDGVRRVWLDVPGPERLAGFDDPAAAGYADLVAGLLGSAPGRTVWLYTPLALPLAERLDRRMLVYDVMDDLSSFAHASPALRLMQQRALREAHVVFAGGRSIHRGLAGRCSPPAHLVPSGVEPEHYTPARALRGRRERPVAGYVGVVDERLDLDLVAGLAERLPDWDVELVGPVFKIEPSSLPQAPNLRYPGMQPYARLPEVMAGFDVALMPFALNDATRSISPTKTLEYLAAGLPVVSTRIADVVADYDEIVDLRDDAAGFADACRHVLAHPPAQRDAKVAPILEASRWDVIAARMGQVLDRRTAEVEDRAGRLGQARASSWVAASSA